METKEIIQIALIALVVYIIMTCISRVKEGFNRYASLSGANNLVLTDADGNLSSIQFPKGMIMLWKGSVNNVPEGWALCDGTKDTPDLRGRFVLGANPSDNKNDLTARPMGTTGGAETHTLKTEEMPSHTHDIIGKGDDAGYCKSGQCGFWPTDRWTNDAVVKASTSGGKLVVENTGGNLPHNNMPPYFALAYIMKL